MARAGPRQEGQDEGGDSEQVTQEEAGTGGEEARGSLVAVGCEAQWTRGAVLELLLGRDSGVDCFKPAVTCWSYSCVFSLLFLWTSLPLLLALEPLLEAPRPGIITRVTRSTEGRRRRGRVSPGAAEQAEQRTVQ